MKSSGKIKVKLETQITELKIIKVSRDPPDNQEIEIGKWYEIWIKKIKKK